MIFAFLSWPAVTLILGVAALLFGPSKIPEIARSLGEGIKEFKKGASEFKKGLEEGNRDGEKKA